MRARCINNSGIDLVLGDYYTVVEDGVNFYKLENNNLTYLKYRFELEDSMKQELVKSDSGIKKDADKERLDLISPVALFELSKVLDFGSKKYDTWNWSKGLAYTRVIAAILRHTYKYLMGETIDPETGISHMAAVMCNAMFLLHYEKYHNEFDDRPKTVFKGTK